MEDSGLTKPSRAASLESRSEDAGSLVILTNLVGQANAALLLQHFDSLTAIGRADALELQTIVAGLTDQQFSTLSAPALTHLIYRSQVILLPTYTTRS